MIARRWPKRVLAMITALACFCATTQARGEENWGLISASLWPNQQLQSTPGIIQIRAPQRSLEDLQTVIGVNVNLPQRQEIEKVYFILDNNPVPVSAVFELKQATASFDADVNFRVNGATPLHIVVQSKSGELFMAEQFVKTSGAQACSAPPITDPEKIEETLGNLFVKAQYPNPNAELIAAITNNQSTNESRPSRARLRFAVTHPSFSGMQKNQVSLLYIPLRHVQDIDIWADGQPLLNLRGSISLSENPQFSIEAPAVMPATVRMRMQDTDAAVFVGEFTIEPPH